MDLCDGLSITEMTVPELNWVGYTITKKIFLFLEWAVKGGGILIASAVMQKPSCGAEKNME